ncbi:GPR endopeptidase [Anaerocolumna sp. AGMB13025]|uniref:GPR endopeptidase n=1 Tax=Anaerocolumna sp. AGMB13025 TaxID=3039116 RepID=UPI00241F3D73|nr:GPR endopeptidase [Anaerocolumna sp. AGMB13025]WFR55110.1 GPR endopeptidase [Anaerocolumna sp. AGMB13025]
MDRKDNSNIVGVPRTDLALEVRETFKEDNVEIQGVVLKEDYDKKKDIRVTTVTIKDQKGADAMGKPIGTYITIEASKLEQEDESFHEPITKEIAKYIRLLAGDIENREILVAGLGNREVTPDALGPQVVDNLFITRHLGKEFGSEYLEENKLGNISAISPGVMAQTGMETSEVLRGIIRETMPKLVIVIDALAARSIHRLNKTVQITDTGISPGSGVGNNRKALNKESLGVDVIALGVPTVVDAATIVSDTMEQFMTKQGFDEHEIHQFMGELKEETMGNMFVTPKNIDESIKRISYTISEALNKCFA